jgi:hypothetical protein
MLFSFLNFGFKFSDDNLIDNSVSRDRSAILPVRMLIASFGSHQKVIVRDETANLRQDLARSRKTVLRFIG